MKVAQLTKDGNLVLPKEITKKLKDKGRFIIVEDDENILLKPIKKGNILSLPAKCKGEKAMTLDEISDEVHKYRKSKSK